MDLLVYRSFQHNQTVPYTITLLNCLTNNQLDLYRICKAQEISNSLKSLLYTMMSTIEIFIKDTAPGDLYGEWAKKEECWIRLRDNDFKFELSAITQDLIDKKNPPKRTIVSEDEVELHRQQEEIEKIKAIPINVWKKIEEWGRETDFLTSNQKNVAWNLSFKIKGNSPLLPNEISHGIAILEKVIDKAPELLFDMDELSDSTIVNKPQDPEITLELIKSMVQWDRVNKRLKNHHFKMMYDIMNEKVKLTPRNKKYCLINYHFISKWGFKI